MKKLILLASTIMSIQQFAIAESNYYFKPTLSGGFVNSYEVKNLKYKEGTYYGIAGAIGMKIENITVDFGIEGIIQNGLLSHPNKPVLNDTVKMFVPKISTQYNYEISSNQYLYIGGSVGYALGNREVKTSLDHKVTSKISTICGNVSIGMVFDLYGVPLDIGYNFAVYNDISKICRMTNGAKISVIWNF